MVNTQGCGAYMELTTMPESEIFVNFKNRTKISSITAPLNAILLSLEIFIVKKEGQERNNITKLGFCNNNNKLMMIKMEASALFAQLKSQ